MCKITSLKVNLPKADVKKGSSFVIRDSRWRLMESEVGCQKSEVRGNGILEEWNDGCHKSPKSQWKKVFFNKKPKGSALGVKIKKYHVNYS